MRVDAIMVAPIWARIGHDQARCRARTGGVEVSTRQRKTADANPVITDNHDGASGKIISNRGKIRLDDLKLVRRAATDEPPDQHNRRIRSVRAGEQAAEVRIGRDEHPILSPRPLKDDAVPGGLQADVPDVHHVMPSRLEPFGKQR
jgi:hypothetical protein